jgi:glycine/sarcosine N-methyltransferase
VKDGLLGMTFYKTITPLYDEIFPTNVKALQFLASTFSIDGTLLDVGAGTGNIAISLSKKGFKVIASEPEEMMIEQIRAKAIENSVELEVSTASMQQIKEFNKHFDGIYCIGNTLAHLQNLDEINEFIKQIFTKLNSNGKIVFQVVNFDKVLEHREFSFPKIQKETFEFERHYDLVDGNIQFTTTLNLKGVTQSNSIMLFPVTSKDLLESLEKNGFKNIQLYGDFEKKPHSNNSPAIVVVARK